MLVPLLSPGSAGAVTGGTPDGAAHPYAVGIVVPGQTRIGCSGVLVRPSGGGPVVVLTAAHCLRAYGATGSARVSFASVANPGGPLIPARYLVDPDYFPDRSPLHDLAVLTFASRVPAGAATLAPVGLLDRTPSPQYITVGYGDPYRGQRRSARENRVGVGPTWLYLKQGTGNSCSADSGGPDLIPGTSTVVALTDLGSCSDSQDLRLDTRAVHDLIDRVAGLGVGATLVRPRISLGQSVVLRVTTVASAAGQRVLRQGYYSGGWHTWAIQTVRRDGTANFTIRPTVRATDRYRVVVVPTPRNAGGISASRDLVVS
jgi:hypothetical protein